MENKMSTGYKRHQQLTCKNETQKISDYISHSFHAFSVNMERVEKSGVDLGGERVGVSADMLTSECWKSHFRRTLILNIFQMKKADKCISDLRFPWGLS